MAQTGVDPLMAAMRPQFQETHHPGQQHVECAEGQ